MTEPLEIGLDSVDRRPPTLDEIRSGIHRRAAARSAFGASRGYRPELDGLRGIAILIVVACHAHVPGFSDVGGLAGVTLFFVLSGYLITHLLLAERAMIGHVNLRAFYMRRALRLFPVLAVVLVVVAIGSLVNVWTRADGGGNMIVVIPAVVLYAGNWLVVVGHTLGPLGHTWSLAIEEQFYLVWPTALLLILRRADTRTLGLALLLIAVLVTPWRIDLLSNGDIGHGLWGTDVHADALLFGCAIALLNPRPAACLGWIAIVGIVAAGAFWPNIASSVFMLPAASVLGALAVAGCPIRLGWRPLAYVGRISYGLYLWHYLFIWWGLPWPVVVAVSVAVASLSYVVIERPFLRLKDRLRATPQMPTQAPLAATQSLGIP